MESTWFHVFEILCGAREVGTVCTVTADEEAWSNAPAPSDALAVLPHELCLTVLTHCTANCVLQYAATSKRARVSCKAGLFEICGMPRPHRFKFNSLFFHHHACHRVVKCVVEHFRTGLFRAIAADQMYLKRALVNVSSVGCRALVVATPHASVPRGPSTFIDMPRPMSPCKLRFTTFHEQSPHAACIEFWLLGNTVTVKLHGPAVHTHS
jgi:hypothetical protein